MAKKEKKDRFWNMENKCRHCTKRKVGCHSDCDAYKKFKKDLEKYKNREKKLKPVNVKYDRRSERGIK